MFAPIFSVSQPIEIHTILLWVQVRIARIFNTYGPRMCIDDGRVVSNFVAQVLFFFIVTIFSKLSKLYELVSRLCSGDRINQELIYDS